MHASRDIGKKILSMRRCTTMAAGLMEEEEETEQVEEFGVHRLPLASTGPEEWLHVCRLSVCGPTSPRSGHGRRGFTSRVRSGDALVLSRKREKPRWQGQLPLPVVS